MSLASFKTKLVCLAALCTAAASSFAAEPLRVATEGTFPPFEFLDTKTGEMTGFELDLVQAMCSKMNRECELVKYKFDAILPAVLTNSVDFAAAGFSVTEERAKKILYTDPFYSSGMTIILPKQNDGSIKTFEDLKGKRVGAQIGSVSHDKVKTIEGAQVTAYDSTADALLSMISGNLDAVVNSAPATDYMLVQRPSLAKRVDRLDVLVDSADMAMIVPPKDTALRDALNAALKAVREDGTYEKLHQKWFGRPSK